MAEIYIPEKICIWQIVSLRRVSADEATKINETESTNVPIGKACNECNGYDTNCSDYNATNLADTIDSFKKELAERMKHPGELSQGDCLVEKAYMQARNLLQLERCQILGIDSRNVGQKEYRGLVKFCLQNPDASDLVRIIAEGKFSALKEE